MSGCTAFAPGDEAVWTMRGLDGDPLPDIAVRVVARTPTGYEIASPNGVRAWASLEELFRPPGWAGPRFKPGDPAVWTARDSAGSQLGDPESVYVSSYEEYERGGAKAYDWFVVARRPDKNGDPHMFWAADNELEPLAAAEAEQMEVLIG